MDSHKSGRAGTLVSKVSREIRQSILAGEYATGEKLPSEAQLTVSHGVSRTVIREAVAALRADGLVEARQGAGVFVLRGAERITSPGEVDRAKVSSVLELLELRAPVEIEAAGLAAIRHSPAQEEKIFECHRAVLKCIEAGDPIREADFALHLAIVEATNNPRFIEFLKSYGIASIPSAEIVTGNRSDRDEAYYRKLHDEHQRIVIAISNGDDTGAKAAMSAHLKGSQLRHRELLRTALGGSGG